MSLAEDLSSIYTKLQTALNNTNVEIVEKGGSEASDIYSICEKIKDIKVYFDDFCNVITGSGTEIIIPGNISLINHYKFYYSDFTKVTISEGITMIYAQAFASCKNLTAITIPKSVYVMHNNVFSFCEKLTSAVINSIHVGIPRETFSGCKSLSNIAIANGCKKSIYIEYLTSDLITQECLHAMIENLADLTGSTTQKFSVGENNLAKIDSLHLAMLDSKNWDYS